jgi:sugar lactone lactonase YvrE
MLISMTIYVRLSLAIVALVVMFAGQTVSAQSDPSRVALLRWYTGNTTGISFATGAYPKGVAFDGVNIWVANSVPGTVMRLRAYDGTPQSFPGFVALPVPNAYGIAFDGANIWVTNRDIQKGAITKIKVNDGTVAGTYPLPSNPEGIAFDGSYIWVASNYDGVLVQVNVVTGAMTKFPGSIGMCNSPHGVASDGKHIWIACGGDNTVRKVTQNGIVVSTYSVGTNPHSLAFDGTNMWVTNHGTDSVPGKTVTRINAATGAKTDYPVDDYPEGIAFDGQNIWVTCRSTVKALKPDGTVVATYTGGYSSPFGVAFDGANIWVTDTGNNRLLKF